MTVLSYPIAFPAAVPASIDWAPETVVAVTRSPFSLASQSQRHPGQGWAGTLRFAPRTRADWAALEAFLLDLNGPEGSFLFGSPKWTSPRGSWSGTPVADTLAASPTQNAARDNQLSIRGFDPLESDVGLKMDMIQLYSGSATRLHALLEDISSDSDGQAVGRVWPRFREDVPDATALTTTSPKGHFRLAEPVLGWSELLAGIYETPELPIIEKL